MLREVISEIKNIKDMTMKDDGAVHNQFKSYKEIKKALENGETVYWANDNYILKLEDDGKIGVLSQRNNSYILLQDKKYDIERCFTK